jgi:hypothetical protein
LRRKTTNVAVKENTLNQEEYKLIENTDKNGHDSHMQETQMIGDTSQTEPTSFNKMASRAAKNHSVFE